MANIDHPATLQELAVEFAKKQPHQVEYLTEESPILGRIKWEQASHPLWNVTEKVTGIEGADFVEMNAKLPQVSVDSKLEKVDLGIMGGEIFVPEDKGVAFGGKEKYFAKKMPVILKDAGNQTEKRIIYDNYIKYAIDNGKAISAGGTTGLYSMVIVRAVPGENGGLYSPEGFKNGAMLDVKPINGGNLYHNKDGVLGYGARVKGYFGMQLMNPKTISAIVNISSDKLPSIKQINEQLIAARANPANTTIFMHPMLKSWLESEYKKEILRVDNTDKGLNFRLTFWNEIPIIGSYNFLEGTETAVTIE